MSVQPRTPAPSSQGPNYPEKLTLIWLWIHVPVRGWVTAVGILVATFVMGAQAARLCEVQEILSLGKPACAATHQISDEIALLEADIEAVGRSAKDALASNCFGHAVNAVTNYDKAIKRVSKIKETVSLSVLCDKALKN